MGQNIRKRNAKYAIFVAVFFRTRQKFSAKLRIEISMHGIQV